MDLVAPIKKLMPQPIKKTARKGLLRLRGAIQTGPKFTCPVCEYQGAFVSDTSRVSFRKYAICPKCGSYERHRLRICVLKELFTHYDTTDKSALHFAPEGFISSYFRFRFDDYTTADIDPHGVDVKADLRGLPFQNETYDFVFASHVLEHIDDDTAAISEIVRVLKPHGIAILPVPIASYKTIEYPNPAEDFHVRAPGMDYFDKYRSAFSNVIIRTSHEFPEHYQLYLYEDRKHYPSQFCPYRKPMFEDKHLEVVPICYK